MPWNEKDECSSESDYELASESIDHDYIDQVISKTIGCEPIENSNLDENVDLCAETNVKQSKSEMNEGIKEVDTQENEYSDEDLIAVKDEVLSLKTKGNEIYKCGDYNSAMQIYSKAIVLCRSQLNDLRSILHANRAACHVSESEYKIAEEDCSISIELNPQYLKAILRRAQVREKLEKLSPALEDYKRVIELDFRQGIAVEAAKRLPKEIEIQQEKMKEECMSKLKDLGNLVLKPFGLSTENFNMVQDPNSGGYNIQFSQDK
ncbi:tetratricopeptide repeat protein 1-like [Bolinopsis microptera]|uniref:tetratricopeptide repeat protein 1-like n=1 Tax=Bolinopsis microptera TaxID=2820187 RepID=UPI00307A04C6